MGWEVVFWCSVFFVCYAFVGYPITIGLLARMFPTPVAQGDCISKVVLVICAYNEESSIREKIENSLALDYPKEQVDILVVSDCSSDKTDQIVSESQALGVRLLRLPERRGKTAAQNLAVANAKGEIVVFSDASFLLDEKSISNLVRNFADPTVGCVSCEDKAISMRDHHPIHHPGRPPRPPRDLDGGQGGGRHRGRGPHPDPAAIQACRDALASCQAADPTDVTCAETEHACVRAAFEAAFQAACDEATVRCASETSEACTRILARCADGVRGTNATCQ